MLQVSDAYKELVKSNIRPKCEPIIKVSGQDNNGNDIELIWRAKNIKDLTYKRGIDPVGRELPYMELTWTEIYTGKLNAESYPEKYNNVTKYMQVELSFVQDLNFYNTWKTIFNSGLSWKELFSKNATWKQLKTKASQETITMPKLFLSARPTISGQTITWVARDLLSFLTDNVLALISGLPNQYFLEDVEYISRGVLNNHKNEKYIYEAILKTQKNLIDKANLKDEYLWSTDVIVDTEFKDFALNYVKLKNYFIVFLQDGSFSVKHFEEINAFSGQKFDFKTMISSPNLKRGLDISNYSFNQYTTKTDENSNYTISEYYQNEDSPDVYYFYFTSIGEATNKYNPNRTIFSYNTYAISYSNAPIVVTPKFSDATKGRLSADNKGEVFVEDNKLNPYGEKNENTINRLEILKKYFKGNYYDCSFECLPVFNAEPTDIIDCETNLYNENGEKIFVRGVLVSEEIKYSGTFNQKILLHEYSIN